MSGNISTNIITDGLVFYVDAANNKSIIGIFQDSLLGSYRLTRNNLKPFDKRTAMNLLMNLLKHYLKKI